MPTQTLGKVKLTPRGAYDPAATYVPLDIVSYGGGSYCVLKNVTGVTPTGDDVNYQLLAKSGADGKSPQISASKTWLVWDANKGEYVDTGVSAAGEKGGEGAPGKAPIIGSNGNWYVWDDASGAYADTGKPSRGEKGAIGAAGADGADGKDGITPTIGENGNWYLGATDTGKPSRGADGATGATGATGEKGADGKSAYAYAVEGGYTGTETEFAAKLAEKMPTALPNPNALTFTGAVTGSYDGSAPLTVNIPEGGGGTGGGYSDYEVLIDETITTDEAGISTISYTELDFSQYNDIVIFFDRALNAANTSGDRKVTIYMLGYTPIYNHSIANPTDSYRSSIFRVLNMGNGNVASFACTANNQNNNPARLDCCGIFPLNSTYQANRDNGFNLNLSGAYIGTIKLKILAK